MHSQRTNKAKQTPKEARQGQQTKLTQLLNRQSSDPANMTTGATDTIVREQIERQRGLKPVLQKRIGDQHDALGFDSSECQPSKI